MEKLEQSTLKSGAAVIDDGVSKLRLIDRLFQSLHDNELSYCHWKSNEHLAASMVADTDLDVLFDIHHRDQVEELLIEIGFKNFVPANQRQYKDIVDFIGLDYASGKIVHLHTHYKLSMGELNLKSYQLNLEDKILSTRVYDDEFDLYRTDPALELVLLFYRQSLKIRNREKAKAYLGRNIAFTTNVVNEYEWLLKRCNKQDIERVLFMILEDDYNTVFQFVTGDFNRIALIKFANWLKKKYSNQRMYSPLTALALRWYRELYLKFFRKYSKLANKPVVMQRINPRGGLSIAVIGADGSGKSTVIANLQSTFKKKLDVYSIYFGSGAGKKSIPRKFLLGIKKLVSGQKAKKQHTGTRQLVPIKKKSFITSAYNCLQALLVANEKNNNLKLMIRAKEKGMLVICDRFPQNQVEGYNDGPMLQKFRNSKNPLLKMIAIKEANIYKQFNHRTPDIIFKLIADAEVVEARKPGETSLEILRSKIEGIKRLRFPESCQVVTINAEDPLEQVLAAIKKKIWEAYN